jgi:branched-subunit amino acid ABC-type transport system permease component
VIGALSGGIVVGLAYGLVAYGVAIIYRTSGYFNMAQGDIGMVAAYAAFLVADVTDNLIVAAAGALAMGVALSVVLQVVILLHLVAAEHFSILVASIAVGTILTEAARLSVNGGLPVALSPELRADGRSFLAIGDVRSVWLIVLAIVVAAALHLWLRRGRGGLALRAVGEAPEVATTFGVSSQRVHLLAMAVAGLTAGVMGLSLAVMFDFLTPFIGTLIIFKALAVVLVFGVEAIWGLLIGAVGLGVLESAITYWGTASYRDLIAFGVILLVLLLRPAGVFRAAT